MIRRFNIIILILLYTVAVASAGELNDSIPARWERTNWITGTAAGAGLTLIGTLSRPSASHQPSPARHPHTVGFVEYSQYAPTALPWAYKAFGGHTRSGWGRMAASQAMGAVLMTAAVRLPKHFINERRPDGSNLSSFPSGHSATVYMGATMMTREMGWKSPWYGFGAYTLAAAIGQQRVMDRRHYPADVAAGAGIGIVATQLGYLLGDIAFKEKNMDSHYSPSEGNASVGSYLQVRSGLSYRLGGDISIKGGKLHSLPALVSGIEGAVALSDHWILALDTSITSTPWEICDATGNCTAGPYIINEIGVSVLPGYAWTLSRRLLLTAKAGAGYAAALSVRQPDRNLQPGTGSLTGEASVDVSMAFTDRLSFAAQIGYKVSGYRLRIAESNAAVEGIDNALNISLTSRINF